MASDSVGHTEDNANAATEEGHAGKQGCRMLTFDYSLLAYTLNSLTAIFLARLFLIFFDCLILGSFLYILCFPEATWLNVLLNIIHGW